jgi:hypothetical protein
MMQSAHSSFIDCCKKIFWAYLRPRISCILPGFEMVKLGGCKTGGLSMWLARIVYVAYKFKYKVPALQFALKSLETWRQSLKN